MHSPGPASRVGVLPGNIAERWADERHNVGAGEAEREAVADVIFAGGVLALATTAFIVIGHQLGGPAPTPRLWGSLAPWLVLPVVLLVGLLLAPGGVVRDDRRGWAWRMWLAACCLASFLASITALNLPAAVLLAA